MNLSKSLYCKAVQCNKMLWLEKNHPEEKVEIDNSSVLDNGTEVGEYAKDLFGTHINIEFNKDLNKMIEDTNKALKQDTVTVTEASFNYNNNFCSVDILKKINDAYELYEVKSSTEVKDIYKEDASYQYYVMTKLGYNVEKVSIVHINDNYIRGDSLELDKLFKIEDITTYAKDNFIKTESKIKEINEYMKKKTEPRDDIGTQCTTPYQCPFFEFCTKHLPKPNIFDIRIMQFKSKLRLYHKGIYTYEDFLTTDAKEIYKQQADFELNNLPPIIRKDKIKEFLKTLSYPLYFLDFETFQQSIPKYKGIKPYQQIPFQYSLHYIEKENGKLQHKEFLSKPDVDPRRDIAESLVKDIPKDVCTLAYNMSFEQGTIEKLAKNFPDLSNHLMNIHDNMKDLMIPFFKRDYYTKDMYGSYSIKYVLPALFPNDPTLNYHNLEGVHNGGEAMSTFANLGTYSKEEQEIIKHNLLKYCELDTYAMVKIWQHLNEVVKDSEENDNKHRRSKTRSKN